MIHKSKPLDKFATIENSLIQNAELSIIARGLLIYLLSLPVDWDVRMDALQTNTGLGLRGLRRAIKELEAVGHISLQMNPIVEGKLTGKSWHVYADPSENPRGVRNVTVAKRAGVHKGNIRDKEILSKETEESPAVAVSTLKAVPATWKPDKRTKEEKLATIKPPSDIPSERDFDDYLLYVGLDYVTDHRPDLYDHLTNNKWHKWNDQLKKWVRIRSWKAYVDALNETIAEANGI